MFQHARGLEAVMPDLNLPRFGFFRSLQITVLRDFNFRNRPVFVPSTKLWMTSCVNCIETPFQHTETHFHMLDSVCIFPDLGNLQGAEKRNLLHPIFVKDISKKKTLKWAGGTSPWTLGIGTNAVPLRRGLRTGP